MKTRAVLSDKTSRLWRDYKGGPLPRGGQRGRSIAAKRREAESAFAKRFKAIRDGSA